MSAAAATSIPVIHLEHPDRALLTYACQTWGVFQLAGHPIDTAVIKGLREASRAFFGQSSAEKQSISRTAENPWGYFDRELTKNVQDWKEIFDVGPEYGSSRPQWPTSPPGFRDALERYTLAVHALSLRVLGMIAECLDMPATPLVDAFGAHTSFLRLNHYPTCPDPAAASSATVPERGRLGIGHHTDAGAITILDQADIPGLQVLHDNQWILVPPQPDTLTVNIGDVVQVWSNDRFPAPLHRVLANQSHERYSTAYFLNPPADFDYAPLLPEGSRLVPRYKAIRWSEFRERRAAGDFANEGREIQISDYLIS